MPYTSSTAIIHSYKDLIQFFKEKGYKTIHVISAHPEKSYTRLLKALHKEFNVKYTMSSRFSHDLLTYTEKWNQDYTTTESSHATIFLMKLNNSQTFLTELVSEELREFVAPEKHKEILYHLLPKVFHHTFFILDAYHDASFMHYEEKKIVNDLRILIISNQLLSIEELIQITFILEFDPEYQKRIAWYTDIGFSILGSQDIEMWRRKAYMLSLQVL